MFKLRSKNGAKCEVYTRLGFKTKRRFGMNRVFVVADEAHRQEARAAHSWVQ
jgi:hypothetical protein